MDEEMQLISDADWVSLIGNPLAIGRLPTSKGLKS
jgi:hypothetical protein